MSKETLQWLNNKTLIGFTEKRGQAWHYRAEAQGAEHNHYTGPVPVEDVLRRLFGWHAVERELFIQVPCETDNLFGISGIDDAGQPYQVRPVVGRKAIVADDDHSVLGIFSDGYQPHQYDEWLVEQVAQLLDDDLGIGSAGLLRNRGQAWVSVEVPENIETPEGITFRPNLVACTSFDGSLSTTYKRTVTAVVCDNTLAAGLGEAGQQVKVRHSRYSHLKLASARVALAIVHTLADEFAAEVARLAAWSVSGDQFNKHLDLVIPVPEAAGRGKTLAENKRNKIVDLYKHDGRVAPWAGTALGVLQAHNTYAHHFATVKGMQGGVGRGLRNMENAINGRTAALDAEVLQKLQLVTS